MKPVRLFQGFLMKKHPKDSLLPIGESPITKYGSLGSSTNQKLGSLVDTGTILWMCWYMIYLSSELNTSSSTIQKKKDSNQKFPIKPTQQLSHAQVIGELLPCRKQHNVQRTANTWRLPNMSKARISTEQNLPATTCVSSKVIVELGICTWAADTLTRKGLPRILRPLAFVTTCICMVSAFSAVYANCAHALNPSWKCSAFVLTAASLSVNQNMLHEDSSYYKWTEKVVHKIPPLSF